jgi:hypothetical protein
VGVGLVLAASEARMKKWMEGQKPEDSHWLECNLVIRRKNGSSETVHGRYTGKIRFDEAEGGKYLANDPKGNIEIFPSDPGQPGGIGVFSYEGTVADGELSGKAEITRTKHRAGWSEVIFETFRGMVRLGLCHGYGRLELSNESLSSESEPPIEEGYFENGNRLRVISFDKFARDLPKVYIYARTGGERPISILTLLEDPDQTGDHIAALENDELRGARRLFVENMEYHSNKNILWPMGGRHFSTTSPVGMLPIPER